MTIYSTKTCGACKKLKADLMEKGIPFKNIYVEDIPPEEQVKLNIRSVPTVYHNGKRYSGIDIIKEIL